MNFVPFVKSLRPVDALVIAFGIFLTTIDFIIVPFPTALLLALANTVAGIAIIAFSNYRAHHPSISWLHDWYPVPVIFLTFKEIYVIIHSMQRPDFDNLLISIDRWLLGCDPTVFLYQFSHPVLTEILMLAYTSFYFIMITLAIELYARKQIENFAFSTFTISYGFYLSYIGYLFFPGIGPRFTLHEFSLTDIELPGIWATTFLRDIINAGESIPKGAANAMTLAQRDVFPSGHTEMTLIVLYFAHKYKLKSRYVLYIAGTLLIIATVYLRYHYVIDLIAGAVFMIVTVSTAPRIARWWENLKTPKQR